MKASFFGVIVTSACILFSSCAKNPVTGRQDFMLMSEGQEVAMGKQSDPEIVSFFGLYEDPSIQKFINEKGQKMAAVSHRKNLKYEFKIVDSPVVNAFAVPGGYVYFTRGIMAHFNNEAEFAGVLGHEIGHITARHSAKQYSKAMIAQIGLVAGSALSPEFAQFADIAQTGIGLLFLKFGRDAESQSDKLGVEYATRIGYDAQEMADFFRTLDNLRHTQGGEEIPTFLSTHPAPADREKKVSKMAVEWKKKVSANEPLAVNRERYLKMIDGIVYGEDPKQGFVENNIFYHPVLKFQFPIPQQWIVQNTPQQVQMGDKSGKALILFTLAQEASIEQAAKGTIEKYKLQLINSSRERVNGLDAIAMVADQHPQQQQGQSIRTLIYLIQYNGNIYTIIGATAVATFNNYVQTFQSTMKNFHALTDPDKLNKQPERIRIKTVQQNGTLSQALKSHRVQDKRMQETAVLNGMSLNESVTKGSLIKVIEVDFALANKQ
jgi:predicted Zn-dependent protease